MKSYHCRAVLQTAVVTCAAALAVYSLAIALLPLTAVAKTKTRTTKPPLRISTLTTGDGLKLTAEVKAERRSGGTVPVLVVTAENRGDAEVSSTFTARLSGSSVADRISRVLRPPTVFWQRACEVRLPAGERKVIELPAKALPAGAVGAFTLHKGKPTASQGEHALILRQVPSTQVKPEAATQQ
jgi:hypothetical protein